MIERYSVIILTSAAGSKSKCLGENVDELLSVVVYFRHGDKIPEHSFPTDEFFNAENFPMGFGQLTNNGINRHYQLGQWFRNRYSTFLPQQYSPSDILVRSTDVDRTLMSAAANLAGLYPPGGDQVWNQNLLWRPIPIHTVPKLSSAILAMDIVCPKLNKLYEENKNSEFYQKVNKEHGELYENLSKYTGMDVTDIDGIRMIRSLFYCYGSFNSSYIPAWAKSLNQTELDYLAGLAYGRHSSTEKMKRLRAGPFFDYLINYFTDVVGNVTTAPKFLMFSSHDTEVASILDAMGVYDSYPPGFANTIIWEMRKDEAGKNYLNLFYRKNESELLTLVVPGCDLDCRFDDFKSLMESVTVDQKTWEEECYEEGYN